MKTRKIPVRVACVQAIYKFTASLTYSVDRSVAVNPFTAGAKLDEIILLLYSYITI
jgi:hypothetical protein